MPKTTLSEFNSLQAQLAAKQINGVSLTVLIVLLVAAVGLAIILDTSGIADAVILPIVIGLMLIGFYILFALKIANEWEKAVVLRFGKFRGLRGPGMFWLIPVMDTIPAWIDHRVMVTPFAAEKTLTLDRTQLLRLCRLCLGQGQPVL